VPRKAEGGGGGHGEGGRWKGRGRQRRILVGLGWVGWADSKRDPCEPPRRKIAGVGGGRERCGAVGSVEEQIRTHHTRCTDKVFYTAHVIEGR